MLTTVSGICRDGRVELEEVPPSSEGARVLVTFLGQDTARPQLSAEHAAELRWRLRSVAEDWDRPEMDVYDEL